MAIPLVALMGKPADSVDQLSQGIGNGMAFRKAEAEAEAAVDARKTQVFQQIGGALKGLEGLPPDQQAAGFDRIKTLAMRTWGDNPEIAAQIEPLTVQNLPDLYSMFTTYEDQMKTRGQMAKDDATVRYTDAGTSLRGAQEGDIAVDNARGERVAGAQIGNYGSMIEDRRLRGIASGYGQIPDGFTGLGGNGGAVPIAGLPAKERAAPSGYQFTEDGSLAFIPGGPADPAVKGGNNLGAITANPDGSVTVQPYTGKLTEAQSKDVVYARRAERASRVLDDIGPALADLGDNIASGMGTAGNYLKSEEYQRAEVAAREAITAFLRKETGAAITDAEWGYYGPMILPQPGDSEAVIKQKAQNRREMVNDIKTGLGAAASLADQPVEQGSGGVVGADDIDAIIGRYGN